MHLLQFNLAPLFLVQGCVAVHHIAIPCAASARRVLDFKIMSCYKGVVVAEWVTFSMLNYHLNSQPKGSSRLVAKYP